MNRALTLRRLLRAGVLTAAFSLGIAAPAPAAEKAIWGPVTTAPGGQDAFDVYSELGVDTFQIQLNFASAAPTPPADPRNPADPAYRWPAAIDQAIAKGAARGIAVAVLVNGSPGWANGGRSQLHAPSEQAFSDFLAAASRRYPYVKRWMIWGEPNKIDRFRPSVEGSSSPRAYATLLDSAYGALKSVSASNIVIGGMTWTGGEITPAIFLDQMRLPDGRPPRLDWFGHNPFPFRFPNLREEPVGGGFRDISDLDTFSAELRRTYGKRSAPKLWLSEYTVQSDKGSSTFELFVSQAEQARWLTASYGIADRLTPGVAGLGWFQLADQPEKEGGANWGLLTTGGARKPAWEAYRLAPSRRFRPAVRSRRRISRVTVRRRGVKVRITAKAAGRVRVSLRRVGGGTVFLKTRLAATGVPVTIGTRRSTLRRGTYRFTVRAPRGEQVVRTLKVR